MTLGELKFKIKDVFFRDNYEHLHRSVNTLKKLNLLQTPGSIVDVGAAEGETVRFWSRAFPKLPVYAFEANPYYQKMLSSEFQHNAKIRIMNYALSDKEDTLPFHITNNLVSSSLNKINDSYFNQSGYTDGVKSSFSLNNTLSVSVKTLDSISIETPILIFKSDTQGHDLNVLTGASNYLKKTILVLTEMNNHDIYENGAQYNDIDNYLRSQGFVLFDMIISNRNRGIRVTEYDAIYINNQYLGNNNGI